MRKMSGRRRSAPVEPIERRTLFTTIWGAAPSLVNLDDVAQNFPTIDGSGQTIAVIDTGIDYNHPNLGGGFGEDHKVIAGYDFVDNDADPLDTDGHGTAVAGVIAADRFEVGGFTYQGIAPGAKLIALRIAPNTSDVPLEKIEAALQWVVSNAVQYGIGIVNLSFGYGRFDSFFNDQTLGDELTSLRQLGVTFVSSSGNGGTSDGFGITAPASDSSAISVGSVSGSNIISEFSQRSRHLTILAVGEGVRSTALGNGFASFDGTSFAAPAVAGTVALIREVDRGFTSADIRSILRTPMPRNYDGDQETGATTGFTFPRLDVAAAVGLALQRAAGTTDVQAQVGVAGSENDIAFDQFGVMHFVYYDNNSRTMKYAVKSPNGNWSTPIEIDPAQGVGTELSLKLDSYGAPRVAYLDSPNGDLKFARMDIATWQTEILDSSGVTGLYPSLAINSNDNYWIAYLRKTKFDLRVMKFNGSTWTRDTLDTDGQVGYSTSITLDNNDRPGIVYGNATYRQLKYARLDEFNQWQFDVADGAVFAAHLSLAYDFSNRPRVSYYEVDTADLKFAELLDGGWLRTKLASRGATGLFTNLQTNGAGNPQILYWDRRTNGINKAVRENSQWNVTRVESDIGKFLSVTLSTTTGKYVTASNRETQLLFVETT